MEKNVKIFLMDVFFILHIFSSHFFLCSLSQQHPAAAISQIKFIFLSFSQLFSSHFSFLSMFLDLLLIYSALIRLIWVRKTIPDNKLSN